MLFLVNHHVSTSYFSSTILTLENKKARKLISFVARIKMEKR